MKRKNVFILLICLNLASAIAMAQTPNLVPNASAPKADLKTVEGDSSCVTRPGRLEPLVLKAEKNSAYYRFLKGQNRSWLQKIRDFFRNIYPLSNQES